MSKFDKNTEYYPIIREETSQNVDISPKNDDSGSDFLKALLSKHKYDIDFTINVLKTLIAYMERHKLNASTCVFSMQRSCQRLLAFLEIERSNPQQEDSWMHASCTRCGFTDIVKQTKQNEWQCPHCTKAIDPIMIDFT